MSVASPEAVIAEMEEKTDARKGLLLPSSIKNPLTAIDLSIEELVSDVVNVYCDL